MKNIVAVSDVPLGFGSPQIGLFLRSLREWQGGSVEVFEPTSAGVPWPVLDGIPGVRRYKVDLDGHDPHGREGRQRYVERVAASLNGFGKIDVLVCFCTYSLAVAALLDRRPVRTVYYATEMATLYGRLDQVLNAQGAKLFDVAVYPDEGRAAIEIARYGWHDLPVAICHNVTRTGAERDEADFTRESTGEGLIYAGTIDPGQTMTGLFSRPELRGIPIELYGNLRFPTEAAGEEFLRSLPSNVRYGGRLGRAEIASRRRTKRFSLVSWVPRRLDQYYAAPNKFYEAMEEGVPSISLPYPQVKRACDRYACGLTSKDFSEDSLVAAILEGMALPPGGHEALIRGCRRAVETEFNWDTQFARFRKVAARGGWA